MEDCNIWCPRVNEELKPKVGMLFDSIEEGRKCYSDYAKEGGFGIRNSSTVYDPKTRELKYKAFVCAKEGFSDLKANNMDTGFTRIKNITRMGCKALIRFTKNIEGKWAITKFAEEHNHPLASPNKVHLLTSHRQVTPTKRKLFKEAKAANIGTSKVMSLFGIQSGGYQNIGCTERDMRNLDWKEKQEEKEYDAQNLLDHFKTEQEGNPSFFYAFEVDDDNKLTHYFWADGEARKAYHVFKDVVVLDTTYETNQYSMIFAPFTGINHHGQSTIFGARFLKDEKIESFVWLFQKFLHVMSDKEPKVIITDQDPAMNVDIGRILTQTHHRFCMWHIMKKVTEKLGTIIYNMNFMQPFKHCIWNSDSPEEFETLWNEVITTHELQNNKWLSSLYEIRSKWIPAYSKDIFTAGCRTTQRSESINSFFSNYVRKKNTLVEFDTNFDMAVKRLRHRELEADHYSVNTKPQLMTSFFMEKQLENTYTRDIFKIFQDELVASMEYGANPITFDDYFITYAVKKEGESKFKEVTYHKSTNDAMCSCKKFATEGIPCRHILLVLRLHFVKALPDQYVLRRWTVGVLVNQVFDKDGVELGIDDDTLSRTHTGDWSNILYKCMLKAKSSPEAGKYFRDALFTTYEGLKELTSSTDGETSQCSVPNSNISHASIRPPDIAKTKGSGKRIKGGKEISMEQTKLKDRLCHGCGKRGVDHDKRNCPVLKKFVSPKVHHIDTITNLL